MSNQKNAFEGNVLITGVTGFIGRHVMYELIKLFLLEGYSGKIYVMIRAKLNEDSTTRLKMILQHRYKPDFLKQFDEDDIFNLIHLIEGELGDDDLSNKIADSVPKEKKLYVIHSAGSVNLFNHEEAEHDVLANNYQGTNKILNSLENYTYKFIFISTVFSCGITDGRVCNDYSAYYTNNSFRNHYERYKNIIEKTVIDHCLQKNVEYQILRPSVVVGRLMETPLYYISKFDVIYGWTKFFWHIMQNNNGDTIRIYIEEASKINIVPVDYVAKIVSCVFDREIKFLNMVYPNSISNRFLYGQMLKAIRFDRYVFVDQMPIHLNKSERFYYRSIDKVFNPYLTNMNNEYDTSVLADVMDEPLGDRAIDFESLANFAIEFDFDEAKVEASDNRVG